MKPNTYTNTSEESNLVKFTNRIFEKKKCEDIIMVIDNIYDTFSLGMDKEAAEMKKAGLQEQYGLELELGYDYYNKYEGRVNVTERSSLRQGEVCYLMSDNNYDCFMVNSQRLSSERAVHLGLEKICQKYSLKIISSNNNEHQLPFRLIDNRNNRPVALIGGLLLLTNSSFLGSIIYSPNIIMKKEIFGALALSKNFIKEGLCMKRELLHDLVERVYGSNSGGIT